MPSASIKSQLSTGGLGFLITATPEEGRQLAFKLASLTIKATQPDDAVRGELRDVYAQNPSMLMAAGHTVAIEFATIATANNYWRAPQ